MTITQLVEIGFDDGPLVALGSVSWTDVTADLRSWSSMRGRTTELGTYSPGTCTAVFSNIARKYDPTNTAGAYYGKLLPRRRIRRTLTVGATSAVVFVGYIQGYSLEYPGEGMDATCTVTAVDAFDVLATRNLPGSAYAAAVADDTPAYYWPMQEVDGVQLWPEVGETILVSRPTSVGYFTPNTTLTRPIGQSVMMSSGTGDLLPAISVIPSAISAWFYDPGAYTLGSPYFTLNASADTVLMVFVCTNEIRVAYSDPVANKRNVATTSIYSVVAWPDMTGALGHVAVVPSSTQIDIYLNGQLFATVATEAGTRSVGGGASFGIYGADPDSTYAASISHAAIWTGTPPSASRIAAHYDAALHAFGHPYGERAGGRISRILDAVDWPSADRDLSTGSTVLDQWLPNGTALAACREVETAEQGAFFISADGKPTLRSRGDFFTTTRCATSQATFGDDAAETPITNPFGVDGNHIDYLRNIVTVTYGQDSSSVTTQDATSRAAYGDLDDSVNATLLPSYDGWLARQLAAYRLRLRKTPTSRVPTVTPQVMASDTHMATVIPLELCDRVTVNRRPTGGSGSFSQECHIQGIRSTWTPQRGHGWQGYLAPAVTSAATGNYFVTADSDRGIIGPAHLALTGTSGDYASTPDSAALDITGDLELVCRARATDWTPGGGLDFGAKWGGTQQSWQWSHMPAGTMRFRYSPDGTTTNSDTSTVAMTATDGKYLWVKVTLDVNNGAGGRDVKFYTAADQATEPTTWTQLGATVTTAGTTSIFSGTSVLAIGSASNGTGNMFNGSIARLIVRNGIGGTTVFDFDASEFTTHGQTTVTEQSSNAATVTINGNARAHPANVFPY